MLPSGTHRRETILVAAVDFQLDGRRLLGYSQSEGLKLCSTQPPTRAPGRVSVTLGCQS